jgi:hypothetical protein
VETKKRRANPEKTTAGKTEIKPRRKSTVAVTETKNLFVPLRVV